MLNLALAPVRCSLHINDGGISAERPPTNLYIWQASRGRAASAVTLWHFWRNSSSTTLLRIGAAVREISIWQHTYVERIRGKIYKKTETKMVSFFVKLTRDRNVGLLIRKKNLWASPKSGFYLQPLTLAETIRLQEALRGGVLLPTILWFGSKLVSMWCLWEHHLQNPPNTVPQVLLLPQKPSKRLLFPIS